MRDLAALQATTAGRDLLRSELTFDDPADFLATLRPPLAGTAAGRLPVYVHQQVYLDYRASVVAKLIALRDLQRHHAAVEPWFLWIDSDRAGSDKLSLRLYLRGAHGPVAVRLAPPGCEDREPRAIALDARRLVEAVRHIEALLRSRPGGGQGRLERYARLRPLLVAQGTLADLARRLSDALFHQVLDFRPAPLLVSELLATGSLLPPLSALLNQRAAFVAAVNARIRALRALDVDPRIKPLAADYLPLFMTDPQDGRRLRLRLEQDGALALAVADDGRGGRHRFELGRDALSLAELDGKVAWSPDVTLPLLVAERFSGLVAGRSSALYLLVLHDALRRTLGRPGLPVLLPREWNVLPGAADSLFEACLDGHRL